MLDLFSGRGGASAAMRDRGWRVVTVELDASFRPDVVGDVSRLPIRGQWDLVWASPPCTEFSRWNLPWIEPKVAPDLTLWRAAEAAISALRPRWWVIENVRGAISWIGRATRCHPPVFLWGHMPLFDVKLRPWKERLSSTKRAERAEIPYELSLALARACETEAALLSEAAS